jgi:RNA polymerase sigma factor (sigma-70 family)
MHHPGQHQRLGTKSQAIPDDSSFEACYRRHQPGILIYIRQHINTAEDAEDVLLEVFLAALEHEQFMRLDEGRQLAWLRRVAHNKSVDHYRRLDNRPSVSLDEVTETVFENEALEPGQVALRNEELALLRSRVARLPELQQEVLRLRFARGLRSADIAQRLNKSDGAIRKLLARSLNLLRSIYSRADGGQE